MATKVTDHYFKFGGQKYFRGNAHLLELCSFGEKKDPIGARSYIDPENKVKRSYLSGRVEKGQPVSVNWNRTSKSDIEVNGQITVYGLNVKAGAKYSAEKMRKADLKLYNLSISEGPLKSMLNGSARGAKSFLKKEGRDGRMVSEIWVVMEAELAEHFDRSGSVKVSQDDLNLSVTASGGAHGSQTIVLSKGATFAYKSHKVKKWNKGKTQIDDMEADYYGLG